MQQPRIFTERLMLRSLDHDDVPRIAELAGDKEIAATTLRIPHPYDQGMAAQWVTGLDQLRVEGRAACFGICVHEGRELVGCIGVEIEPDHRRAELGYWIGRPFWGHGYATEAGAAVIEYAFDMLHLHRVYANHFRSNQASGRVLEKIGMKQEGVLKQHLQKWGSFHDAEQWGLTEEDYLELVSKRIQVTDGGGCCGGHR